MTSKANEAYVWIWLPDATAPIVAGRIARDGARYFFNYGRSYLEQKAAMALYLPELPLRRGEIAPPDGLAIAGALRDAAPDAWGRRVIVNRLLGTKGAAIDVDALDEMTYLLESGSDRIGALDFQRSSSVYEPRGAKAATLEELQNVAERVQNGVPIAPDLEQAMFHGSSLGGARPKAAIETQGAKFIAKFSASGDVTNVVKAEFVAMRLAKAIGLNAAPVKLERTAGKDVLLVERFDRVRKGKAWTRKAMISALTLFGLDEMMGRYGSYRDLADIVRARFTEPKASLRELFGRLVFNVLCGNTDDHARNHAAFWDGEMLTLTPAYDICPQNRTGREANQAMEISDGNRASTLANCLAAATHFLLTAKAAQDIVAAQIEGIRTHWRDTADGAALTKIDKEALWRRRLLNPYAFDGAPAAIAALDRD